ncbi:MAG: type II toxin-antitoxin system Phd/YefM family antitoxin [Anaerolineae bacterium]|nr:type II toxin-antitoxin system Phd/YefM family antitoxin [Anaerolineae bacterium]
MGTKKISSEQARTGWRDILDTVATGDSIIIERYGKPIAVLVPYQDYEETHPLATVVREQTAVYQTNEWETLKAELAAEIKADLLSEPNIQQALLQYQLWQLHEQETTHLEEEFLDYEKRHPLT